MPRQRALLGSDVSMQGKRILLTGATDGLGKAIAHAFAKQGATLIVHGRSPSRCQDTVQELIAASGNWNIRSYLADFGEMRSVLCMANDILRDEPALDLLVNNAGIGIEPEFRLSADRIELVFQVNYLAAYALSVGLAPAIFRASGRIICVSSSTQIPLDFDSPDLSQNWDGVIAYARSKWALTTFVNAMARLKIDGREPLTAYSVHPGTLMPTKLVVGKFPVQDALETGVASVTAVSAIPSSAARNGTYFDKDMPASALASAYQQNTQDKLIGYSRALLKGIPGAELLPPIEALDGTA